jgi:hypothetical protein
MIGPGGGELVATDGTRVEIPAGALPATATLTLTPVVVSAPPGAAWISSSWTLQPIWLQFAQPIAITFPVDRSKLDAGAVVLTTAQTTNGYLALAATLEDGDSGAQVSARSSHFATGGVAAVTCPATCSAAQDPVGATLQCTASCLSHAYSLSCSGPTTTASSCTCSIDGAVTASIMVNAGDGGAQGATPESIYSQQCGFPSSAFGEGM